MNGRIAKMFERTLHWSSQDKMDSYPSRAPVANASVHQAINRSKRRGLDKSHLVKEDRA